MGRGGVKCACSSSWAFAGKWTNDLEEKRRESMRKNGFSTIVTQQTPRALRKYLTFFVFQWGLSNYCHIGNSLCSTSETYTTVKLSIGLIKHKTVTGRNKKEVLPGPRLTMKHSFRNLFTYWCIYDFLGNTLKRKRK